MIKICRWVYGANAPDDGILMEPAPREDGTAAWRGDTPARAQAFRWNDTSGPVAKKQGAPWPQGGLSCYVSS